MYSNTDVLVFTCVLLSALIFSGCMVTGMFFSKEGKYPAGVGFALGLAAGIAGGGWAWLAAAVLMVANSFIFVCSLGGE